jgi:hypothetical protein
MIVCGQLVIEIRYYQASNHWNLTPTHRKHIYPPPPDMDAEYGEGNLDQMDD